MKNTNDFSKARVGDKLWSIPLGDCEVFKILENKTYPISVVNRDGAQESYDYLGKRITEDSNQSLFWSNPNIIAPEKPARMKEVKMNGYIDMRYVDDNIKFYPSVDSTPPMDTKWLDKATLTYQIPDEE